MIAALLRKERKEHGVALSLIYVLCLLWIGITALGEQRLNAAADAFSLARSGLRVAIVVFSFAITGRLVRKEYEKKTQLFLEGLPLSRMTMLLVKAGFGATCVGLIVFLTLAQCYVSEIGNPAVTLPYFLLVLMRALGFALAVYGVFFLSAMLGRYRIPLLIALAIFGFLIEQHTTFEPWRIGPLALVDETFTTEKTVWPLRDLAISWSIFVASIAISLLLSTVREGSIAAMLGEKMSRKEIIFIVFAVCFAVTALNAAPPKKALDPFDLKDARETSGEGVTVRVKGASEAQDDALAKSLHAQLVPIRRKLGLEALPTLFVAAREDLDANTSDGESRGTEFAVVVRANYAQAQFDRARLISHGVHLMLEVQTNNRAFIEENHWLLDGFSRFEAKEAHTELRALYAKDGGLSASDFRQWEAYRERVGDDVMGGAAASLYGYIVATYGAAAAEQVARAVLTRKTPKGLLAIFDRKEHSAARELQRATGNSFAEIFDAWSTWLETRREQHAEVLKGIPRLSGTTQFVAISDQERRAQFSLAIAGDVPSGARVHLYHMKITPLTGSLSFESIARTEREYSPEPLEVNETFRRGQRVWLDATMISNALDCEVRLGARRVVVE